MLPPTQQNMAFQPRKMYSGFWDLEFLPCHHCLSTGIKCCRFPLRAKQSLNSLHPTSEPCVSLGNMFFDRIFYVILILIQISYALPLNAVPKLRDLQLERRVAYSVVNVDGGGMGASATANANAINPDVTTIVATSDQTTTVILTATPRVDRIEVTKTIQQSAAPTTVAVTVVDTERSTPSPEAQPKIEVVNADGNQPTSTSERPITTSKLSQTTTIIDQVVTVVPVPLSSSQTTTSSPLPSSSAFSTTSSSCSTSTSSFSSSPLPESSSHVNTQTSNDVESWANPSAVTTTSTMMTTTSALTSSYSKSYDNGMWHTSYPAWNATSSGTTNSYPAPSGTGTWWQKT